LIISIIFQGKTSRQLEDPASRSKPHAPGRASCPVDDHLQVPHRQIWVNLIRKVMIQGEAPVMFVVGLFIYIYTGWFQNGLGT
jgi:hypothetical protein